MKKLAGRLGFEPRQMPPKGIVLPLDDRPTGRLSKPFGWIAALTFNVGSRSRVSREDRLTVNSLFRKHLAPVLRSRQGSSEKRRDTRRPQSLAGCFRISAGQVQPEERRTGPGQRSMEGCLRSTGGRKKTLDIAEGRMLAEDDSFEVVLDPATDPGADKRGLLRSGEVLSY